MPEAGQAPATEPGQVPTTTPTATVTPGAPPADGQTTFDAAYVAGIRQEAAQHRTAARAAEAELAKLKQSQMTDAERTAARLAELEKAHASHATEVADLKVRLEIERLAYKAGIRDVEAAALLLKREGITVDEAGAVTGVGKALDALVKDRPWLLQPAPPETTTPPPAGSPANPASTNGAHKLSRDDIRRMTPDQINANWPAVQAAMVG